MSRKDNKGRVLFKGETQRKDGRYAYSYTDQLGKRHSIYDKDLVKLRLKEKEIHRRMDDGLDPAKATLFIQSQIAELCELSFYYMDLVILMKLTI